jgi:hypothetical protein
MPPLAHDTAVADEHTADDRIGRGRATIALCKPAGAPKVRVAHGVTYVAEEARHRPILLPSGL